MPALLAGFVTAALASLAVRPVAAAGVGEPAPDFVLKSASGSNLRLSEYRGEVVLVVFWASWCGDCRERLGELAALTQRYADAGLRTLSVSLDADRGDAREAAKTMGLVFPVLFDDAGDVGELYAADTLPAVALVDRAGVLRGVLEGRDREVGVAITERVRELLRE